MEQGASGKGEQPQSPSHHVPVLHSGVETCAREIEIGARRAADLDVILRNVYVVFLRPSSQVVESAASSAFS